MVYSQRNRDLLRDPILSNVSDYQISVKYQIALKDYLVNLAEPIAVVKGIVYQKMKWLTFFQVLATKQFQFSLTSIQFLSIKMGTNVWLVVLEIQL